MRCKIAQQNPSFTFTRLIPREIRKQKIIEPSKKGKGKDKDELAGPK